MAFNVDTIFRTYRREISYINALLDMKEIYPIYPPPFSHPYSFHTYRTRLCGLEKITFFIYTNKRIAHLIKKK